MPTRVQQIHAAAKRVLGRVRQERAIAQAAAAISSVRTPAKNRPSPTKPDAAT